MPIADNLKLTTEIIVEGQIASEGALARSWLSIFHYRRISGSPVLNKTNLASAFEIAFGGGLQALLNNTWTASLIRVRMMEDITDPYLDHTIGGGGWSGAVVGDRMPPDNVAFMLIKTALRGKSYRSGKWWSPMSESDTTAGTADLFNAAALARLATVALQIKANITDANGNVWVPQVVSKTLSSYKPIPALVVATQVTDCVVRKSIGRFKRRAPSSVY